MIDTTVLELIKLLDPEINRYHRQDQKEIKMAKRSYRQILMSKQSSAYGRIARPTPRIHAIDGSSKREVSRLPRIKALRSWTIAKNFVTKAALDAAAEKAMNPHGWSKKLNPICPSCFTQKALNGSCCE